MQPEHLRACAEDIWRHGVNAVDSERLVAATVRRDGSDLIVADCRLSLERCRRITVVGAGKAGAGMAAGFEAAVGPDLLERVNGWVNVPSDCVRPLQRIHLHAARPAAVNEPTADGVAGTQEILRLVGDLTTDDACVVLLSGGGSALLPGPAAGLTLEEKLEVTRLLMNGGATIQELNCVRKHLSTVKGGRLAAASGAGQVITLIISDVIGDPLDVIASGPTVPDSSRPEDALRVLQRFSNVPPAVIRILERAVEAAKPVVASASVENRIIGNNATARLAAAARARELGFDVLDHGSENAGLANAAGVELARAVVGLRADSSEVPRCILSGGEPTVDLVATDEPRRGGRNQELVLAAVAELWDDGMESLAILSGGTDGEDGPTDAAGAVATADTLSRARTQSLDPQTFLAINNSYPFLEATDALLITGPTHTNVMDLRVALVGSLACGDFPVDSGDGRPKRERGT